MRHTLAFVLCAIACSPEGGRAEHENPMVSIPAGPFSMGCMRPELCSPDEFPSHPVHVSAFEIQRIEVSQLDYELCRAAGKCSKPAAHFDPQSDEPVRDVTWAQAQAYCAFAGMRLPTEAEWEKAARGPDGRSYPWGETEPSCELANFAGCGGLSPSGLLPQGASAYGVLDMAGNVFEWVADRYAADYYAKSDAADPKGPPTGTFRVARGGSFDTASYALTASHRISANPDVAYDSIGFRCARSIP